MKKTVFLAYTALLLSFLPPLRSMKIASAPPPQPSAPTEAAATVSDVPAEAPFRAPERLCVLVDGQCREMDMQEYLLGVLAAEMPASFQPEALKAQAVAARTYALYCAAAKKHGQAAVCSDPGCCQAWQSEEAREEKWGADCAACTDKLVRAIRDTEGEVLSYEGRPVFAAFHAASAGKTEDCGALWSPQPYLVSVSSPENAETVPNYISCLDCSALDFRDTILSAYPAADFSSPEEDWIGEIKRDDSGRVSSVSVGGQEIPGAVLRRLFSLRSTAFTLAYEDGVFVFRVTGSGHGVGMSQYGANVMAARGADYREILSHYYPGTLLTR